MAYEYTWINGNRVEVNVAAAFRRMAADFQRDTGCELLVRDGTRTNADQWDEWNAYVNRGYAAPKVAYPGTSNHEEDGPNGPRSIDIYDSCNDAGVTVFGTARDAWMQNNAGNYGFENEGNNFGEPWHKTFRGQIGVPAGDGSVTGFPAREKYGAAWVISAQQKLQQMRYDIGQSGADGFDGQATQNAVRLLQARGGLEADGIYGPDTNALADRLLAGVNGHRAFPLPAGYYFGPEDGPAESVSGYHSYKDDLYVWQQQMNYRGWPITPDGLYGPTTAQVAKDFQAEKGLTADGLIGPDTWNMAWEAPVTPPGGGGGNPVDPDPSAPGYNATSRSLKDIQAYLKVPQTNAWDKATSDAVYAFQGRANIEKDYVWGMTSDGLAFPPAGARLFGVDYSFARPDPAMLALRNVKFVCRYLASTDNKKALFKSEQTALEGAGISVAYIYEEDGKELAGGAAEGTRVANLAEKHRNREGFPAKPIYFNVDYDAQPNEYPAIIAALRAINAVIGLERTGLYAGYNVIKAAFDAGVISFGMQTYAWSDGQWDSRAQLRQWSNGQWGDSVDFQYSMAKEFGQTPVGSIPINPEPEPEPDVISVKRSELTYIRDLVDDLLGK